MSVSILYFEENRPSADYAGYGEVNRFHLPEAFEASPITLRRKGKSIAAWEFGWGAASAIYRPDSELP
ncbi:hypothetical protein H9Q10_02355 [Eikenella sp. S3360]|uniref:Uncharacterized protein n=1 Tax=Eikenella glucosivorans TaxID=2766967 RepID=A0ABS0N885_9NEIS|nr:hypothetical protein [Eikenella glucosivorans]MBH5328515.1 hypothetical protein [Eikenella glucosivorans]